MVGTHTYQSWYLGIKARAGTCKVSTINALSSFPFPSAQLSFLAVVTSIDAYDTTGTSSRRGGCEHMEVGGGG
jgi:hypothetical protein